MLKQQMELPKLASCRCGSTEISEIAIYDYTIRRNQYKLVCQKCGRQGKNATDHITARENWNELNSRKGIPNGG